MCLRKQPEGAFGAGNSSISQLWLYEATNVVKLCRSESTGIHSRGVHVNISKFCALYQSQFPGCTGLCKMSPLGEG